MENYEQKLKEIINSNNTPFADIKILSKYFPELKESEDERIRKWLIEMVEEVRKANPTNADHNGNCSGAITWLEKQGNNMNCIYDKELSELLHIVIRRFINDPDIPYSDREKVSMKVLPYVELLEKQGEQDTDISSFPKEQQAFMRKYVSLDKITLIKLLAERDANNAEIIESFEKQGEQKPTDKVEPKFKVGDWVIVQDKTPCQIEKVTELPYNHYQYWTTDGYWFGDATKAKLWTIQDAKGGDVLAAHECLVLFKEIDGLNIRCYCTYHYLNHQAFYVDTLQNKTAFCPATKEQHNLLFQKIKEAGYEWDDEKKELKKIEQSRYHNDGLYYAIDILEKTLGKVEGYQSDDGKMEHQIAIETVNALYHKKTTEWSEEDEEMFDAIIADIQFTQKAHNHEVNQIVYEREIDWLKVLKDRMKGE